MNNQEEKVLKKEMPLLEKVIAISQENYDAKVVRHGTPLEKGVSYGEEKLLRNEKEVEKKLAYWTAYPDRYLDLITPSDSNFSLYFYQRIFLRACLRFKVVYLTAPRAFSKTFISILALYLMCMFKPRSKFFITSPVKTQAAQVAKEKIHEIWSIFPLLEKEIIGGGNFGRDYVTLTFRNKSVLDIVGALDSTRGGRRHGGLVDELRDHDGDIINSVVLPLMNVSRRTVGGLHNTREPSQIQLYMTSSSSKASYAYEKLIEVFEMSIMQPSQAFCFGCDYRIPMMHGLLDKEFITQMKLSPTFKEETFAQEYLSVWLAASDEAWFNFDKLNYHRKLLNPEVRRKNIAHSDYFYLLSVDVARLNDQTVVTVFRVHNNNGRYFSRVVNIFVLGRTPETRPFSIQARDLKMIIRDFNPREVVIDTNGLGIAIADEMIRTQVASDTLEELPPYGFMNDKEYQKIQPANADKILYSLKATTEMNSDMYSNAYSRTNAGMVTFLVREQEAKKKLLATKKGQKMSVEEKVRRLMPHEMTTKLFEEMGNLRVKSTGGHGGGRHIVLERINSRFPKDKFSSFIMGLWRIKELEESNTKKEKRKESFFGRKLTFFSGGN